MDRPAFPTTDSRTPRAVLTHATRTPTTAVPSSINCSMHGAGRRRRVRRSFFILKVSFSDRLLFWAGEQTTSEERDPSNVPVEACPRVLTAVLDDGHAVNKTAFRVTSILHAT